MRRDLKHIALLPYDRHFFEPGIEILPTPGHRPGAICTLVALHDRPFLLVGDTIWHNGREWFAYLTKSGYKKMIESVHRLMEVEFDVLLAYTRVDNPSRYIRVDPTTRPPFLEGLLERLPD